MSSNFQTLTGKLFLDESLEIPSLSNFDFDTPVSVTIESYEDGGSTIDVGVGDGLQVASSHSIKTITEMSYEVKEGRFTKTVYIDLECKEFSLLENFVLNYGVEWELEGDDSEEYEEYDR